MRTRCWAFGFAVLLACGGGKQESPPPKPSQPAQGDDQTQFVVTTKDGKSTWPPVGPGCDALVACCTEAAKGKPEVDLACKLSAAAGDCAQGRKAIVEVLENDKAAVPASCR